ncbi:acetyl-CoA carboxylase biotin carboxyl carrier protein subunit [bacterium]|nr:acetyl-CoA carboxylase biotin carboxyl carrier protein subunit [bacterium]
MIFFLRQGEAEHTVRVEFRNQKLMVKFDDQPEAPVDLVYMGNDCNFLENGKVFSANVVGGKGESTVWRPEGNLQFSVESEYRRIVSLLRGQELTNENNVYAKMPGKIVKVIAKVGDVIEKNAPLIVMEAMKMENEIRSPQAGKITNIYVKEGQAVETGVLLIELGVSEE